MINIQYTVFIKAINITQKYSIIVIAAKKTSEPTGEHFSKIYTISRNTWWKRA